MNSLLLKYGTGTKQLNFDESIQVDYIQPNKSILINEEKIIGLDLIEEITKFVNTCSKPHDQIIVGIAINDKSRPVPYLKLIPPLLKGLNHAGIPKTSINFFIANGTHLPDPNSLNGYLGWFDLDSFHFHQHDCNDMDNLVFLGSTTRNTQVLINRDFYSCDLKISIGNIEPHHFAGYSGGYKTVAIGLAGLQTITENHKLLLEENSIAGIFEHNPVRQDIEEIGKMTNLHFCLNCIMDENKQIVRIIFERPDQVMEIGIPIVQSMYIVEVPKKYDVVIASAGGYPKDINFYQAQKALTNAAQICMPKGTIFLFAECREGSGSEIFEEYMKNFNNPGDLVDQFKSSKFQIGKHKAYLIAKLLMKFHIAIYSALTKEQVESFLLDFVYDPIDEMSKIFQQNKSIAFIPDAVVTIPNYQGSSYAKVGSK